jgi:hypothetical protein
MSAAHAAAGAVEVVTSDDLDAGIATALEGIGLTFEELEHCAERHAFPSERARLIWFMIAPDESVTC